MKRCSGLIAVAVLAASVSSARADSHTASAKTDDVVIDHGKAQRRIALWTAVAGGALLAGSATLGLVERSNYDAAVARGDADGANSARDTARYEGTALFLGGAVTLGVAAAIYITAPKLRERHVIVAPTAGPDHVGLTFGAGF